MVGGWQILKTRQIPSNGAPYRPTESSTRVSVLCGTMMLLGEDLCARMVADSVSLLEGDSVSGSFAKRMRRQKA